MNKKEILEFFYTNSEELTPVLVFLVLGSLVPGFLPPGRGWILLFRLPVMQDSVHWPWNQSEHL